MFQNLYSTQIRIEINVYSLWHGYVSIGISLAKILYVSLLNVTLSFVFKLYCLFAVSIDGDV